MVKITVRLVRQVVVLVRLKASLQEMSPKVTMSLCTVWLVAN